MSEFFIVHEQLITGVGMFLLFPVLIFGLIAFCALLSVLKEEKISRVLLNSAFWILIFESIFGMSDILYRCLCLGIAFAINKYLKVTRYKKEEIKKEDFQDR